MRTRLLWLYCAWLDELARIHTTERPFNSFHAEIFGTAVRVCSIYAPHKRKECRITALLFKDKVQTYSPG